MTFNFMILFLALFILVSYPIIIYILFKGKQYNRFFATFLLTILPVFGSVPGVIMASQYERRIKFSPLVRLNDVAVRIAAFSIQIVCIVLLFQPFFSSDGITVTGFQLISGVLKDGAYLVNPTPVFYCLVFAPALIGLLSLLKTKKNTKNVFTYVISLFICVILLVASFFSDAAKYSPATALWLFCIFQTLSMYVSLVFIVKNRNAFLEELESYEICEDENKTNEEEIPIKLYDNSPDSNDVPPVSTYKCSKCGKDVQKGTICECRKDSGNKLDRIMEEQNKKDTSDFCVYCKTKLQPGEICKCTEGEYGITVKPEQFEGRKCKYCGQVLVGDSKCVCEKIMENSKPADDYVRKEKAKTFFEYKSEDNSHISDEMAELEKKIEERLSLVKDSLSKSE